MISEILFLIIVYFLGNYGGIRMERDRWKYSKNHRIKHEILSPDEAYKIASIATQETQTQMFQ